MMKTKPFLFAFAASVIALASVFYAGRPSVGRVNAQDDSSRDQWEYLVIAGGNVNLASISGDQFSKLRKAADAGFNREASVLERNLDKLGAKGWQLVSIHGAPNDPIYYLKRSKEAKEAK